MRLWDEDTYLDFVKNIDGPLGPNDQFERRYNTFAVDGGYVSMHELLFGLTRALMYIKPEGGEMKERPVYLVWRQKPEQYIDDKEQKYVNCRLTFYTEQEYMNRFTLDKDI